MAVEQHDAATPRQTSAKRFAPILGANIKARRIALAIAQGTLAERIGVSQTNLSQIELGNQWVREATLISLCDALDVEPNELMTPDYFAEGA